MVAYARKGGPVQVAFGTTGAGTADTANFGITFCNYTSAESIVLEPPVAGCQKWLVCNSSSTGITPLVRFSTAQTITAQVPGANTAVTMFRFAATRSTGLASVVKMIGINSTQWLIESVFPAMATGAGVGTVTPATT